MHHIVNLLHCMLSTLKLKKSQKGGVQLCCLKLQTFNTYWCQFWNWGKHFIHWTLCAIQSKSVWSEFILFWTEIFSMMQLAASHVLVLVFTKPASLIWVKPSLRVPNDSPLWSGSNIIQGSEWVLAIRGVIALYLQEWQVQTKWFKDYSKNLYSLQFWTGYNTISINQTSKINSNYKYAVIKH